MSLILGIIVICVAVLLYVYMQPVDVPKPSYTEIAKISNSTDIIHKTVETQITANVLNINALQEKVAKLDEYIKQNPEKSQPLLQIKEKLFAEISNIENTNIELSSIALLNKEIAEKTGSADLVPIEGFSLMDVLERNRIFVSRGHHKDFFAPSSNNTTESQRMAVPTDIASSVSNSSSEPHPTLSPVHSEDNSQSDRSDIADKKFIKVSDSNTEGKVHLNLLKKPDASVKEALMKKIKPIGEILKSRRVKTEKKTLEARNKDLIAKGKQPISKDSIDEQSKQLDDMKSKVAKIQEQLNQLDAKMKLSASSGNPPLKQDLAQYRNLKRQIKHESIKAKQLKESLDTNKQILENDLKGLPTEDTLLAPNDAKTLIDNNQALIDALKDEADISGQNISNTVESVISGNDLEIINAQLDINASRQILLGDDEKATEPVVAEVLAF